MGWEERSFWGRGEGMREMEELEDGKGKGRLGEGKASRKDKRGGRMEDGKEKSNFGRGEGKEKG